MKKNIFLVAMAALMILPLSGAFAGGQKDDGSIKIGTNIYNFQDNFMNGVMRPELERYAAEKGVEVEIVDSENQQAKLNDQVDVFITKGVDALAINLVDPAAAGTIIEKAKAADIPLVLFNKEATEAGIMDTYDKVWYVGTDSAESGVIQGQMMVADWQAHPEWDLNGDGAVQYVMLKGEPGHPDAEARTKYSMEQFEAAGIKADKLALEADPNWSTQFGNDKMAAWLTSNFADKIELVVCNNDGMAFGAATALAAAGVEIPLYGVDALAQAVTMIGEGEMSGTVLNDGVNQARATLDLAINAAKGLPVTEGTSWTLTTDGTKAVRVAYVAVTPENYKEFEVK